MPTSPAFAPGRRTFRTAAALTSTVLPFAARTAAAVEEQLREGKEQFHDYLSMGWKIGNEDIWL